MRLSAHRRIMGALPGGLPSDAVLRGRSSREHSDAGVPASEAGRNAYPTMPYTSRPTKEGLRTKMIPTSTDVTIQVSPRTPADADAVVVFLTEDAKDVPAIPSLASTER